MLIQNICKLGQPTTGSSLSSHSMISSTNNSNVISDGQNSQVSWKSFVYFLKSVFLNENNNPW